MNTHLWHCGRAPHSSFHSGELSVAPSAIKINEAYIHLKPIKEPIVMAAVLKTAELAIELATILLRLGECCEAFN